MDLDITVGFSTTNKVSSKIIRSITGGYVSHTWLAFNDPVLKTRLVLEAEWYGYFPKAWDIWKKHNTLVADFRPTGPSLEPALAEMGKNIGTKYDWLSAALVGFWKLGGRWLRGRMRSPWRLMCSEAVLVALQSEDYSSVKHFNPEVTSPQRLMDRAFEMAFRYDNEQFELLWAQPEVAEYYHKIYCK